MPLQNEYNKDTIKESILNKLLRYYGCTIEDATPKQVYAAVASTVRDQIMLKWRFEKEARRSEKAKRLYYLSIEFLTGRWLHNNLLNLCSTKEYEEAFEELGLTLRGVLHEEPEPALGNGGLGRLAACFLDSLATLNLPAMGCTIRYEYGLFRQRIVDGQQVEVPDEWLTYGNAWEIPTQRDAVEVCFGGQLVENWVGGRNYITVKNTENVIAVPYDMYISGKDGKGISRLRLWAAKSEEFDMKLFNGGDYLRAMERNAMAEVITKVLYPEDNHPEGKSLRLSQQYFLVSATIQDIIHRHLRTYSSLENLPDLVAIHLNDTHPVLTISEMMRIILDECGYGWDEAWDIVTRTVAYTNHTVMAEALECWDQELFKRRLPRNYQIIEEINRRFCAQMHDLGLDGCQVGRMAVLNDGIVRMANLAVIGSHSINGVSKLHSEILKETVFKDFYQVMPDKFKNVTNGIAHRRWLNQANPGLASLVTELIGDGYVYDAAELKKLMAYKNDPAVLEKLKKIKLENKKRLAAYVKQQNGVVIDPNSIFDCQVKRMHEYKRQLLNGLHILSTYQWLRENPNADFTPKTYFFGAKAAPGYYFAKEIIRFIAELGEAINKDPAMKDKLKVIYLEDYRVTVSEILNPAAEISQQISLAGTEASGTSNMKLMINGAITLGTLDGANVEIHEAVGSENMFLFGMTTPEVNLLRQNGYNPYLCYNNNPALKKAIDEMSVSGFNGMKFEKITQNLLSTDRYMVLADYSDYAAVQEKASQVYKDQTAWNRMSLVNIAQAGRFAADRAIREYARDIWGASPVKGEITR